MADAKKILLIEDEQILVELYQMKFENEGLNLIVAMDGEDGLMMAKKEKPDLILLDIVLPGMNGYQVLDALKADKETKNIKVYILSNLGQKEEIDQGLEGGADGYLIKANITPSQLVDSVRKVLDGQGAGVKKRRG